MNFSSRFYRFLCFALFLLPCLAIIAQANLPQLTLSHQKEDFAIFKTSLLESHAGIFFYVSKPAFEHTCDSIYRTFKEGESLTEYYLKLRFILASLHHGHDRISLPSKGQVNYKMAVLDTSQLYLPFRLIIVKDKLVILSDCSHEQRIPQKAVVKSINGVSTKTLIQKMLPYMPSDGINQTYKIYVLYNYYYFHYLFNLFYPRANRVAIKLENSPTLYNIALLKPGAIDSIYSAKNHTSLSSYGKQLEYRLAGLPEKTAYLRVSSFYKGLIESFRQSYEPFLDSCFTDIKQRNITRLIIDVRDNEGGGDNYESLLFSYLDEQGFISNERVAAAGTRFTYKQYAGNSSDGVKMFMDKPTEFLRDDSSLLLKNEYAEQMKFFPRSNGYNGNVYVLANGGTFSAGSNFIRLLYNYRNNHPGRTIRFIGEENGGDVYSQVECAGQSYVIELPNSHIKVDMPFLCTGTVNRQYPAKRLPDLTAYQTVKGLLAGRDDVLSITIEKLMRHNK